MSVAALSHTQTLSSAPTHRSAEATIHLINRQKISQISRILTGILKHANETQSVQICLILSSISHSIRPLHIKEIEGILDVRSIDVQENNKPDAIRHSLVPQLLCDLGSLITVTSEGFILCREPLFKKYLQHRPVSGIDQTAKSITDLCLSQVEQIIDDRGLGIAPFSSYASQSWTKHYRSIQSDCPNLARRVHYILCHEIAKNIESNVSENRTSSCNKAVSLGIDLCQKLAVRCKELGFERLQHTYESISRTYQSLESKEVTNGSIEVKDTLEATCLSVSKLLIDDLDDLSGLPRNERDLTTPNDQKISQNRFARKRKLSDNGSLPMNSTL